MNYLEKSGILQASKIEEIQGIYQIDGSFSFTKILLYIGSVLVGAGILSFIASNWDVFTKLTKFLLIVFLFILSNFAGFKMERSFPKTSRSFYYLGVFVFGAGIFLVGQMFHFGGDVQDSFLWWSLGILPLAWVLKDRWILFLASLFVTIYMLEAPFLDGQTIPYWILLWIFTIFVMNEKMGFFNPTGFVTGIQPLLFILCVFHAITSTQNHYLYILGLVYVAIGIAAVLMRGKLRDIFCILGYFVHGSAAFMLSFGDNWPVSWINIPFSILYLLFILFLIKKGSLSSIIILCIMIFRFYFDISFAFLPKSFVFIIGGLLLLGFGFYFEKQRKKGGGAR